MGQILKDNLKELIVDSAINDLYEYGYNGASMRRIADRANMTVGNLYRYFKNKDDLVNYIIEPVLDKINSVLLKNTNQTFDLNNNQFDINKLSFEEFYKTFDDIAVELCHLYREHPRVFIIIMKSQVINEKFLNWFVDIIKEYISFRIDVKKENIKELEVLSRMYGVSLFAAVQDFFLTNKLDKEDLLHILQIYFRTCISIVEMNFNELEV